MAIRREALGEGYQPPLSVVPETTDQITQPSSPPFPNKEDKKKIGVLTRVSSGKKTGVLLDWKRRIEENFKRDGSMEMAIFYTTKDGSRQMVLIEREHIQAVIDRRQSKHNKR